MCGVWQEVRLWFMVIYYWILWHWIRSVMMKSRLVSRWIIKDLNLRIRKWICTLHMIRREWIHRNLWRWGWIVKNNRIAFLKTLFHRYGFSKAILLWSTENETFFTFRIVSKFTLNRVETKLINCIFSFCIHTMYTLFHDLSILKYRWFPLKYFPSIWVSCASFFSTFIRDIILLHFLWWSWN